MTANQDALVSVIKSIVTVDYMSTIEASELFCSALMGKTFELIDLPVVKSTVDPTKEIYMIKYQGKHRNNTWFLSSFLKNAFVESADTGVDCPTGIGLIQLRQQDMFMMKFTVDGFEASTDPMGNPYYSKGVLSDMKIRKFLKGEMLEAWQSRKWSDLKEEATNLIRSNYAQLFKDNLCENGVLTAAAEAQYRLGTIKIRAAQVADLT